MRRIVAVILLLLVAAGILGCGAASKKEASEPEPESTGRVSVTFEPAEGETNQAIEELFQESGVFQDITDALNESLRLPEDVEIVLAETGEPDAYYDPETHQIVITYELIDYLANSLSSSASSQEDLETAVQGATVFVALHEMGHALVDILQLPITGKEEDAVDQLATVLLVEGGEETAQAAIDAGISFYSSGDESKIEELDFADVHSLDKQRFYNIMTWVYGSDPETFAYLVEDGFLPEDRAQVAQEEYEKIASSWATLLEPYLK